LVNRFATRRLIDASATLDAADRALLNIWVNRGLDDGALARMTGLSVATIAQRRARVIAQLSDELGLPPEHVRSALTEIAVVPDSPPDDPAARGITLTPSARAPATVNLLTRPAEAHGRAAPPDTAAPAPRRRWMWVALVAIVLIAAIVLVIVLGSGGSGGSGHRHATTATQARASAQTVSSAATPAPAPTPTATESRALVALPGGLRRATGTVAIAGTSPNLDLNLSVRNLPPLSHGHYEVWLYESLIYSQPLGRLRAGVTPMSVALPRDARRYPWIDVSIQPPGAVFHSGDSVLRAANPRFAEGS
jgi:hypothetical protein